MRLSSRSIPWLGLIAGTILLGGTPASAADAPIAVGEIAPPPAGANIDAAEIRDEAEGAIKRLDPSRLRNRRRVVVSFAVTRAALDGPVSCTVNATLRDARTGAMIAVIEAGARADAPPSPELTRQVARGAVRNAVDRIPTALAAP